MHTHKLELKACGGVQLRNKKGDMVFWLKGKDPDDGPSFVLCLFRPELADTPAMKEGVSQVFEILLEMARAVRLPIFDASDVNREIKRFVAESGGPAGLKPRRAEDITVKVKDLVTSRRVKLTLAIKPATEQAS